MGREAEVSARFAGGEDAGRLQYEPPKLIFRGSERRVFEGEALKGARAEGGDLVLVGGARFHLGEKAAQSWAAAIVSPKGRLEKLGVSPRLRIAMLNLDDPDFVAELSAAGVRLTEATAGLDLLFYGADSATELDAIGDLGTRLAERGALWVISLKGRLARIKDVEVMAAGRIHGLVDIKVCAFSESRTALKLVRRRSPAA
jgi:hypothetical protein